MYITPFAWLMRKYRSLLQVSRALLWIYARTHSVCLARVKVTAGAYMQLSRTNSRFCQQRLYQIFKTLSSSILRISKACEGVRSERKIIINVLMIKMCYSLHISVGTCTILSADLYYKNTAQYIFVGVNKTTVFAVQTCLFCSAESFRSCSWEECASRDGGVHSRECTREIVGLVESHFFFECTQ